MLTGGAAPEAIKFDGIVAGECAAAAAAAALLALTRWYTIKRTRNPSIDKLRVRAIIDPINIHSLESSQETTQEN